MSRRLALPALSVLGLFACSLEDREFPPANPQPNNGFVVAGGNGSASGGGGQGGGGGNGASSSSSSSSSAGGGGGGVGGGGQGLLLYPYCGCVGTAQNNVACDICLWDPLLNGCTVEDQACDDSGNCVIIRDAMQTCQSVDQSCMDAAVLMSPGGGDSVLAAYLECACMNCRTDCPAAFCQ